MSSNSNPVLTPSQLNYSESAQWKQILQQALNDLRCAAPAVVQSFDPDTQTVTVQILMSELVKNPNGPVWTAIYPIALVPILVPRAGGFCLTLPITAGDEGLLVFSDTMFDLWWQNGGQQPPPGSPLTQPNHERRRHDVTDCFFIPGVWNQTRLVDNYSQNSAQVRSDDGTVIIDLSLDDGVTITAPKVTVNSQGDVDVNAQGDVNVTAQGQIKLQSEGNNTEIDGVVFLEHTHSGVQTGGGNTGPVNP
jgi:hypothetical protein